MNNVGADHREKIYIHCSLMGKAIQHHWYPRKHMPQVGTPVDTISWYSDECWLLVSTYILESKWSAPKCKDSQQVVTPTSVEN